MAVAEQIPYPKLKKRLARKQNPHVEAGGSLAQLIAPLAEARRISQRSALGFYRLLQDLQADAGTSGNIAALYGERVQSSRKPSSHPAGWTQASIRWQWVNDRLGSYEKEMLNFLIRNGEYERKGLHDWGKLRANYQETHSASGYAVGQIAMVGEKLADLYEKYRPV
jgi:hypothetical protein